MPNRNSFRLAIPLVLLSLASGLWPATAVADAPPGPAKVEVSGLKPQGPDLVVSLISLDGSSGPVTVEVVDADGLVVASASGYRLSAAPVDLAVRDLFQATAVHGLAFEVMVRDGWGVAQQEAYPFQLALDCDDDARCAYRVLPGVAAADVLLESPQLARALDDAIDAGSSDPLRTVLANEPTLAGDLYAWWWQLERLEQRHGGSAGCMCFWAVDFDNSPNQCGATRHVRTAGDEGSLYYQETSLTRLSTRLRCVTRTASQNTPILFQSGHWTQPISLSTPSLQPCKSPCLGRVDHEVAYVAQVEAGLGAGDRAIASDHSTWVVDDIAWPLTSASASVESAPGSASDEDSRYLGLSRLDRQESWSEVVSTGLIDIEAITEAYASISSGLVMGAGLLASCTSPLEAQVSMRQAGQPSPGDPRFTQLSIVIGNCNGN